MEKKQETFHYTYSAEQQEEVRNIRRKYTAPEEDKMEQLRRLDRQVTQRAQSRALVLGVIGALILGTGMSLVMTDLGQALGLTHAWIPGVIIGILGLIPAALAYPVYVRMLKKERQRIAPEILRLTDELMK